MVATHTILCAVEWIDGSSKPVRTVVAWRCHFFLLVKFWDHVQQNCCSFFLISVLNWCQGMVPKPNPTRNLSDSFAKMYISSFFSLSELMIGCLTIPMFPPCILPFCDMSSKKKIGECITVCKVLAISLLALISAGCVCVCVCDSILKFLFTECFCHLQCDLTHAPHLHSLLPYTWRLLTMC